MCKHWAYFKDGNSRVQVAILFEARKEAQISGEPVLTQKTHTGICGRPVLTFLPKRHKDKR